MEHSWKVNTQDKSLLGAKKVLFDHSVRKISEAGMTDYDLFLYKMKDQKNFYDRKHVIGLNPASYSFKNYWGNFAKNCIEGKWVLEEHDGKAVWVYMMPKLFYYINYVEITGTNEEEKRVTMKPDLSSVEWIQFSYIMAADGFSGFTNDHEYTCHRLVERLYKGEELTDYETDKLHKDGCILPNGELKIYVDAWEYLTRFYLNDNPRGNLGQPIYKNRKKNIGVFGARGVAKSYISYAGDFMYMFTFGDVENFKFKFDCSGKKLFAMGCGTKDALNRSIKLIKSFYDNQPGQFKYPDPKRPKYMGPFYKNVFGTWAGGQEIEHRVKTKQNNDVIVGSSLQMNVITPDRTKIAAGDRFIRLYFEEAGFLKNLLEVHSANKDSMEEGAVKVGGAYYTGTSGDLDTVEGIKALNDNPSGYQMMSIPNYWKNQEKDLCLFLSAIYKYRQFKDEGGNNDLVKALKYISKERLHASETKDSQNFDSYIMYSCVHPDEMLRPNKRSFLPSKEASERLSEIDAYDYFKINATMGEFKFSIGEEYGVEFRKDNKRTIHPILEYNIDRNKIRLEGMPIVYEHPPHYIPKYLFWIMYDPVSKPGQGETIDASLNSIIVYKWFYTGDESTLEDCIVAEWIGRHDQLDETYELVIKMAKYYNALIFPETNTSGFVNWCKKNSYGHLLQQTPDLAMKELNSNYQNKKGQVGFSIYGDKMKPWLLQKLRGWLLRKRGLNTETGEFDSRTIEHILSPRILNEIINFSEKGNFDHISSLLGLMLLLTQLDLDPPNLKEEKKEDVHSFLKFLPKKKRRRSRFEQSIYK